MRNHCSRCFWMNYGEPARCVDCGHLLVFSVLEWALIQWLPMRMWRLWKAK